MIKNARARNYPRFASTSIDDATSRELDELAARCGVSRATAIRAAIEKGLPGVRRAVERDLKARDEPKRAGL